MSLISSAVTTDTFSAVWERDFLVRVGASTTNSSSLKYMRRYCLSSADCAKAFVVIEDKQQVKEMNVSRILERIVIANNLHPMLRVGSANIENAGSRQAIVTYLFHPGKPYRMLTCCRLQNAHQRLPARTAGHLLHRLVTDLDLHGLSF
jgi:hypothetical protein